MKWPFLFRKKWNQGTMYTQECLYGNQTQALTVSSLLLWLLWSN